MQEKDVRKIYKLYITRSKKVIRLAQEYKCTTQYIYILFKKYGLPKFEKNHNKKTQEKKCEVCSAKFLAPYPFTKKTCSRRCANIAVSRKNTKVNIKEMAGIDSNKFPSEMSEEEKRLLHNTRVLYYYRNSKKIKKSKKEWSERNKEKISIYLKRAYEKKLYGKPKTPLL